MKLILTALWTLNGYVMGIESSKNSKNQISQQQRVLIFNPMGVENGKNRNNQNFQKQRILIYDPRIVDMGKNSNNQITQETIFREYFYNPVQKQMMFREHIYNSHPQEKISSNGRKKDFNPIIKKSQPKL